MLALTCVALSYNAPLVSRPAVARAPVVSMGRGHQLRPGRFLPGADREAGGESRAAVPRHPAPPAASKKRTTLTLGSQKPPIKILNRVEELRVLSNLAEAGVLSAAEDAGLFSKLEAQGAFSSIEKLLPLGARRQAT
eukprot:4779098-Prymnesium_polylepis.1